jgi:flagellar assembly protein FliH
MSDLKKYMFEDRTFDPDFDPDDENSFEFAEDRRGQEEVAEEEAFYEEPPAPTFSEEEVAAAQQTAFDEGKTAGLQEANAQFEHMMATALTQISATLPQVFQQHVQSQHDHEALALSVARAVGKKVIPAYAEKNGLEEILAVVSQCLEPLRSEPRIIVKVHESLREETQNKLVKLADQIGFDGRVVVMAHEDLVPGDCRVEWAEGGAERNSETLWQQIDEIIERNLTEGGNQSDTQIEARAESTPAMNTPTDVAG